MVQKNNTSRLKNNRQNSSKESNEINVKFNKENNKIKERLSPKNFFIDENRSEQRQISDEYLVNFSLKENLNKIKIIKNNKIKKKKKHIKNRRRLYKK